MRLQSIFIGLGSEGSQRPSWPAPCPLQDSLLEHFLGQSAHYRPLCFDSSERERLESFFFCLATTYIQKLPPTGAPWAIFYLEYLDVNHLVSLKTQPSRRSPSSAVHPTCHLDITSPWGQAQGVRGSLCPAEGLDRGTGWY